MTKITLDDFPKDVVERGIHKLKSEWGFQDITQEMLWFYLRYSQMVGQVLNKLDSSIFSDRQWQALRKEINKPQYDYLRYFLCALPKPYGLGLDDKAGVLSGLVGKESE